MRNVHGQECSMYKRRALLDHGSTSCVSGFHILPILTLGRTASKGQAQGGGGGWGSSLTGGGWGSSLSSLTKGLTGGGGGGGGDDDGGGLAGALANMDVKRCVPCHFRFRWSLGFDLSRNNPISFCYHLSESYPESRGVRPRGIQLGPTLGPVLGAPWGHTCVSCERFTTTPPPPLCENKALVRTTGGVVSATFGSSFPRGVYTRGEA